MTSIGNSFRCLYKTKQISTLRHRCHRPVEAGLAFAGLPRSTLLASYARSHGRRKACLYGSGCSYTECTTLIKTLLPSLLSGCDADRRVYTGRQKEAVQPDLQQRHAGMEQDQR